MEIRIGKGTLLPGRSEVAVHPHRASGTYLDIMPW